MDQETRRHNARLQAMEATFETPGWDEIVRELENEIEVIKGQLLTAETEREVAFLQGKADQCFRLIYLADSVANLRVALEEPEDAPV